MTKKLKGKTEFITEFLNKPLNTLWANKSSLRLKEEHMEIKQVLFL